MSPGRPRLELAGISKTFGSARVVSTVDLTVAPGEIRGLAGQNGSGKSTLIKIITGLYAPDPGATVRVDGTPLTVPVRWRSAHAAGISVVHQDLGLLDHLSVAENVCVGGYPTTRLGRIDRRERDRRADSVLDRIGADVSARELVGELTAAQRAEVAIARALRDHAPGRGLMILDESTRALRGDELDRVHAMMRRVVAGGSSVILISHSLAELASVTDRVTVLRDGVVTADLGEAPGELTDSRIARAMLGTSIEAFRRDRVADAPAPAPRVVVTGVSGRRVRDLSFHVGRGEILGITGAPGSGYEEIPALLCGATRAASGKVVVDDRVLDLTRASVVSALRAGIALVPERRHHDGLAVEMPVRDNVTLPQLRRQRAWYVSRKWHVRQSERAIQEHAVRPANPRTLVRELSGGNQQKVLLAKWLAMRPALLVLHEPTQAVDVGARRDILAKISAAAAEGTSVLVVSSEADDLTAICNRVLICERDGLAAGHATDVAALLDQLFIPTSRNPS